MSSVILIDGDESRTGIELRWYSERHVFVLACDSPATGEATAMTLGLDEFRELTEWIKRSGISFSDVCPTCDAKFGEPCVSHPSGRRYGIDHAARRYMFPPSAGKRNR